MDILEKLSNSARKLKMLNTVDLLKSNTEYSKFYESLSKNLEYAENLLNTYEMEMKSNQDLLDDKIERLKKYTCYVSNNVDFQKTRNASETIDVPSKSLKNTFSIKILNENLKKNSQQNVNQNIRPKVSTKIETFRLLLQSDLDLVPKYMKNRLTLNNINPIIVELNSILEEKYKLIFKFKSKSKSFNPRSLTLVKKYLSESDENTKHNFFISDNDLKDNTRLPNKRRLNIIFIILRHLQLMNEIRNLRSTIPCGISSPKLTKLETLNLAKHYILILSTIIRNS
ncbi:hypothetical protein A3Q56_04732 [Intoshia linei]|uniref:SKA complex subunit 1 n=1 Tax=Intoshia linei TaxID=1819745 RepID=A0A177B090_9BILA|nr:hypothetical protein A3Q56_04732 [Intoshia linei]